MTAHVFVLPTAPASGGSSRIYLRTSSPRRRNNASVDLPRNQILVGDALQRLRVLLSASVDAVITSPPYFLLRNYGVDGQLGAEPHVDNYVERIVAVADEVARVLKPTGSFWLNLGDSYSRHHRYGAAPKGMLLAPERILLALHEHGWIVRNKIVWAKPNPMPTSVRDRLSCTWEPLYLLTRNPSYYFDLDAIRVPHLTTRRPSTGATQAKYGSSRPAWAGPLTGANDGLLRAQREGRSGHILGKNPGDVWTLRDRRLPRRALRHLPTTAHRTTTARHRAAAHLHELRFAMAHNRRNPRTDLSMHGLVASGRRARSIHRGRHRRGRRRTTPPRLDRYRTEHRLRNPRRRAHQTGADQASARWTRRYDQRAA